MWRVCVILLMALWMDGAAWARMYQWVDPRSGRTQMSGVPPAWYRSGQPGPRIFVFENGQIIDDTRISVSEDKRQTLREQAFKNAAPVIAAPEADTGDTANSVAILSTKMLRPEGHSGCSRPLLTPRAALPNV